MINSDNAMNNKTYYTEFALHNVYNNVGDISSSQYHTSGAVHLTGIFPPLVADM